MVLSRLSMLPLLLVTCLAMADTRETDTRRPVFLIAEVWPWGYFDENQQPAGLIHQFATRLASRADIDMQYRVLPPQRVLADLERNEGDFTMLFQNPDLHRYAQPIGLIQVSDILLIARRDSAQQLTLEALAGKPLGYIAGTNYGEAFHADRGTVKIPITGLTQAIRMLQLGRLEAMITSDILLHHSLKEAEVPPHAFRARLLTQGHESILYMASDSPNAHQLPAVSAALEAMHEHGELADLFRNSLDLPPMDKD